MFRRIDDFQKAWKAEADKTLQILDAIPDQAMGRIVTEGHRDLRRMGWHLVESLVEMPGHLGLKIEGAHLIQNGFIVAPPPTMKAVRDTYARASESLASLVQAWTDADLELEDELYGDVWMRGVTLSVIIIHQAHHRGQMTVLMRQAGLAVPGIYGPAKEGWAAYGLSAPKV